MLVTTGEAVIFCRRRSLGRPLSPVGGDHDPSGHAAVGGKKEKNGDSDIIIMRKQRQTHSRSEETTYRLMPGRFSDLRRLCCTRTTRLKHGYHHPRDEKSSPSTEDSHFFHVSIYIVSTCTRPGEHASISRKGRRLPQVSYFYFVFRFSKTTESV